MFGKFMKMNTTSSSGSGTLPGNTTTNPKEDLKVIIIRRRSAYPGSTIPTTSSTPVVERETKATKDTIHPTNNGNTEDVQPSVVPTESLILNSELVNSSSIELVASPKLPEKLGDLGKFLIPCDFPEMAECLALADLDVSINIMQLFVWNKLSLPDLSPTCMTLELIDRLISRLVGVAEDVFVKVVVDFDADPRVPLILGRSFLKTGRALIDVFEGELTLRVGKEAITFNLDQTLRYSTNYNDMTANRIDVIDMACEEYLQEVLANRIDVIDMACEEYLQEVLGFFDVIVSGNPTPYYDPIFSATSLSLTPFRDSDFLLEEVDAFLALEYDPTSPEVDQSYFDLEGDILLLEILMEDDFKPAVQHQRRVNPKIQDVIKKEVLKLLDAGFIYSISVSPWVSPIHCVPKNGGFIVVENKENELILTRLVTRWRVCIDYRKLNEATRKDHFPLPFMDQMLERLAGNEYYCFYDDPLYPITECSSCGALYTTDYCCSDGSLRDRIICDLNKTPDLFQEPPQNCPKCGNSVDGQYYQRCALLRKKFKENLFTYCIENGIFQDFQYTFEPSNDNTNVVNALQEPFVVKQNPSENSSQSPPQINHHCCYGCGDSLEDIFCHHCTCEFCGKGAHYGYNCSPKVPVVSNPEPCHNQNVDELPQTLTSFHPTCYSGDEDSFVLDSTSNIVHYFPNVFNHPLQPSIYSYEFYGNDAYYGHDCPLQVLFTYDPKPCYNQDFNFPQNFQIFQQQYPCCTRCRGPHETCQCDQLIFDEPYCENCGGSHMSF
nr:reverse transcriptase domain-containing protein [Tanacetum cinerariifolium]